MASTWTLAPALSALLREVNARWPHRSKASDGTIGDTAHAARQSEHNPDTKGVVRAVDITVAGIDKAALLRAVIGDSRVHYVISDRKIYSRSNGWTPAAYYGANPHDKHVHISLRNRTSESADWATVDKAAADTSSWGVKRTGKRIYSTSVKRLLANARSKAPRKRSNDVIRLQRLLWSYGYMAELGRKQHEYGKYGPLTRKAVKRAQKAAGFSGKDADGYIGLTTLRWLAKRAKGTSVETKAVR